MRLAIKLAATLAVLAVMGLALTANTGETEGANCNEPVNSSGRVSAGSTTTYGVKFCSDPAHNFAVYVTWGKASPSKDLALRVTDPTGHVYYVDNDPNAGEVFFAYAPLPEGDWKIEVVNEGSQNVRFDIVMGFG